MHPELFESKDLYLTAFLCLNDQRLQGTRKEDSITYFQFKRQSDLNQLILDFFGGSAKVDPIRYVESIKRLRRLITNSGVS